jgi:hypothetical protein
MKVVYIAGPMRGLPDCNFPAFDAARDRIATAGHIAVSPADHDRDLGIVPTLGPDEMERRFVQLEGWRWDIEQVADCDAVYMLRGWESSTGARAEHAIAVWLHKEIWYESGI